MRVQHKLFFLRFAPIYGTRTFQLRSQPAAYRTYLDILCVHAPRLPRSPFAERLYTTLHVYLQVAAEFLQ